MIFIPWGCEFLALRNESERYITGSLPLLKSKLICELWRRPLFASRFFIYGETRYLLKSLSQICCNDGAAVGRHGLSIFRSLAVPLPVRVWLEKRMKIAPKKHWSHILCYVVLCYLVHDRWLSKIRKSVENHLWKNSYYTTAHSSSRAVFIPVFITSTSTVVQ